MLKIWYWLCTDGQIFSASSSGAFLKISLNIFKIVWYCVVIVWLDFRAHLFQTFRMNHQHFMCVEVILKIYTVNIYLATIFINV